MSQKPNKKDLFVNVITAAVIVAGIEQGRGAGGHPHHRWVARVVAEAEFVPEDALPDNLAEVGHMALEFIQWQCQEFTEQPEWYKSEWMTDRW